MKKLLIILPNNLGDVLMALPVLEGAKRADPETHCTFFVEQGFEAGLVNNRWCDRICLFDRKSIRDGVRTPSWRRSLQALDAAVKELQAQKFDQVVNLSQHPYTAVITGLLSCPHTAGRTFLRAGNHAIPDPWSRYLYAIPFARNCNRLHATDVFRKIAGVSTELPESYLHVSEPESRHAWEWLLSRGIDPAHPKIMVLQPGAAFRAKCWPIEHFAALGRMLADEGWRIVITGAPAEAETAHYLGGMIERSVVTAGELSFRQTIALLPFAAGCVSGDTAIMHAAAALKRRVYALFGPTSPVETGPYGEGHFVFGGRCRSRPCFCFDCKTRLCMKSISPAHVFKVINGGAVEDAGADLYRTTIGADGMYRLDPVYENGTPYYRPFEAEATIRFVEPGPMPNLSGDGSAGAAVETGTFHSIVTSMALSLDGFDAGRSPDAVGEFETRRAQLASLRGIGAFWTALLNLQLNSVPLLDPLAGIEESRMICLDIAEQAERAVASDDLPAL